MSGKPLDLKVTGGLYQIYYYIPGKHSVPGFLSSCGWF